MADVQTTRALLAGLVEELTAAMGALLGAAGSATETPAAPTTGWAVRATASGTHAGHLAIGLRPDDAATLAKLVMGFDDAPEDAVIADLLQEACNQAFSALGQTELGKGTKFAVGAPSPSDAPTAEDVVAAFTLSLTDGFSPVILAWGQASSLTAAANSTPTSNASAGAGTIGPAPEPPRAAIANYPNLDVVLDIDLPLSVRFGETEMTLDALTKLGPGSVIDLGRSPDDPVDVLVNGRMVARGEVVVVAGSYGVRITEVVSAADRLRSMGA